MKTMRWLLSLALVVLPLSLFCNPKPTTPQLVEMYRSINEELKNLDENDHQKRTDLQVQLVLIEEALRKQDAVERVEKKSHSNAFAWTIAAFASALLLLASFDADINRLTWPSHERIANNLHSIKTKIKDCFAQAPRDENAVDINIRIRQAR